ncbi:MAG: hypothetical protein EXQ69_00075 [Acidimicrobiia bacterium]|nr:hypothetical protein [Acidimicrobiia bacterium]
MPESTMFESTMQNFPLTIGMMFRHGRSVYPTSEVVTYEGDHVRRATYSEVADRSDRLAAALTPLGVSGETASEFESVHIFIVTGSGDPGELRAATNARIGPSSTAVDGLLRRARHQVSSPG